MLHTHSFIYHTHCIMFFSQYFSFPCQYHSTNAPYSFIYLPPALYNVFLPVLHFSPVSIIPPMLHTRTMLFSQHFSFQCQYHSTNAPFSSIHLPLMQYNFLSPSTSISPVNIFPTVLHTYLHIITARTRKSNGRSLEPCKKQCCYRKSGSTALQITSILLCLLTD